MHGHQFRNHRELIKRSSSGKMIRGYVPTIQQALVPPNYAQDGIAGLICPYFAHAIFPKAGGPVGGLVGAVGIEPTTFGLKGRCSTTELRPWRQNCFGAQKPVVVLAIRQV